MRVLVTGGSGMLGSRITRLLLEQGHKVRVTYLPGDSVLALGDSQVEHSPADLLDDALTDVLEGVEVVFHTAALVTFQPRLYEKQMEVNVEGTRRLLEAAAHAGVRRLVHTSTVNTLGIPPAGTMGDEGMLSNWGRYRMGYMDSKLAAEQLVLASTALETVAVLPGLFFGPGDVNVNAGSYIQMVAKAPYVVPAPCGGNVVAHVDDVAAGHLLALERGQHGARYVLGGEPMSYHAIFECIADALGRRRHIIELPAKLMLQAGQLCDWLGGKGLPAPFSEGLAVAGSSKLYYSSRRAKQELGWSHRSGEAAIRDGVRWFRGRGLF